MSDWANWNDAKRETFKRDGNALILEVGMECAVNIKNLSHECTKHGIGPNHFDEGMWANGLAQILGYHLPSLQPGEAYKLVITDLRSMGAEP